MKEAMMVMLLIIVVSASIIGCSKAPEQEASVQDDVQVTQPEVDSDQVADESVSGWVDEGEEVEIGEMI